MTYVEYGALCHRTPVLRKLHTDYNIHLSENKVFEKSFSKINGLPEGHHVLSGVRGKKQDPAIYGFCKNRKSIVNFVEIHITNAILGSVNNIIQMTQRRARGFRNTKRFINMIYFFCGKLKFNYPLYST